MLAIDVTRRLGAFVLEAALDVPERSTVAVAGESGAGKTTLLRLLAGLDRPDRGSIVLDGATWFDAASGVACPPEARSIGWVPQDHALFPHLSVLENVAFGLRAAGRPAAEARRRAAATLERLGIADLAGRGPGSLSGGQQQRAALARALVLEPRLLLLDEPLAALDVQTRRSVRGELRRLLGTLPCATLLVTHDAVDALALGNRIAVLEAGRLTQYGERDELLARPRSAYVAEFLGVNLFRGAVARRESGVAWLDTGAGEIAVPDDGLPGERFALVDAREVTLARDPSGTSARNAFHGAIVELIPEPPDGQRLRVALATRPRLVAEITRAAAHGLGLAPGVEVWASFKATGVRTFR